RRRGVPCDGRRRPAPAHGAARARARSPRLSGRLVNAMPPMKKYLLACWLALAAIFAQAGVGLAELPGVNGDGPVTVYYPSSSDDKALQRGPFALHLAWQGDAVRGNGRLVVISHGSGAPPWVQADLARA